jgi:G3E family GTPase
LDSVITVVDAKHIMDRLNEQKPEGVENEAVEQVCFADKIILNKTDLADDKKLGEIETSLRKLNPNAPIQRTMNSKVNPKELLNIGAFDLDRVLGFDPEFLDEDQEHEHDSTVSSVSIKVQSEVSNMMLEAWVERIIQDDGANLYRYKGLIAVKGFDQKFLFQGVGMLFSGGFSDTEWGKDEVRESRFVFIGKNLDHEFYKQGFMACQADKPLRFPVGALVEANVGEFKKGKILMHWDEGNAYRVELQDGTKTNVWAPIDIDAYIRPTACA